MLRQIIKWLLIVIVVFIVIVSLLFIFPGKAANIPNVSFHYAPSIDNIFCFETKKSQIDSDKIDKKINQLKQMWQTKGTLLLKETTIITGHPFPQANYKVNFFLCSHLSAMGFPIIIIPLTPYLVSANNFWIESDFIDTVYHEILHVYIARLLKFNLWTPLLSRHKNENLNTRIHLHLFALQKAVYYQLGWQKDWERISNTLKSSNSVYKRALQIIEGDGYQPYVNELRNQ